METPPPPKKNGLVWIVGNTLCKRIRRRAAQAVVGIRLRPRRRWRPGKTALVAEAALPAVAAVELKERWELAEREERVWAVPRHPPSRRQQGRGLAEVWPLPRMVRLAPGRQCR